jgi:glycosyltransferase involved in cell wall biosynthesis
VRTGLAALYRHARLVLMTSDAEGFGLPVVEALACGAPVLASDLPPFREVGGAAVTFCPRGDVDAWSNAVIRHLEHQGESPSSEVRREVAARYSWKAHAETVRDAYLRLS